VTSPLHYVTYVRVYGATPTVVYVGYTPGYLGTIVTPDGVVVYGTGVVYTPWVGSVWYPPPPTYGTGTAFAWGATTGFVMGAMTTAAVWGCCASSSTTTVNVNKTTYNYNNGNVYSNWSKTTATSGDKSATVYSSPDSKVVTNNQNNNVYASHDGNVYKKQDGTWDKWNGSNGWQPVNTSGTSATQSTRSTQTSPTSTSGQPPGATQGSTPRQNPQQAAQSRPGEAPGSARTRPEQPGAEQGRGSFGQRFGGAGGSPGFGQRFSGGGLQGLENESAARERGFARFSGARAGGGFFRR
jgi:hypothetical protein